MSKNLTKSALNEALKEAGIQTQETYPAFSGVLDEYQVLLNDGTLVIKKYKECVGHMLYEDDDPLISLGFCESVRYNSAYDFYECICPSPVGMTKAQFALLQKLLANKNAKNPIYVGTKRIGGLWVKQGQQIVKPSGVYVKQNGTIKKM